MNNVVFLLLALLFLFFFSEVSGQDMFRDTLTIEEVSIVKSRKKYLSEGHGEVLISEHQLEQFTLRTLAEMLQYSTNVNIRSYGSPGSSASISFRGLGASQTQVNWNGFPVNSVTLGSANVSNVELIDNQSVTLSPGASGVNYGSGTFGGAVNIDYNPTLNTNINQASGTLLYGSMDAFNGAASYQTNTSKLKLAGSLSGGSSDGDFKYFDEIKNKELRRVSAGHDQLSIQQYFIYAENSHSLLKGGIWGHTKDLNLPAIEGSSSNTYENQNDSTLRMFLEWKKVLNASSVSVKGAWFYSDQHYVKKENRESKSLLIDSRIKSKTWFGDFNYRYFIRQNFSTDIALTYNYAIADVSAYQGQKVDRVLGIIYAFKYHQKGHKVNIGIRKDFGNNDDSDILFDIGGNFKLISDIWYLRGAFSQNFRRPTFNDLFWIPGGDINLKPETGHSYEMGTRYTRNTDGLGMLTVDASLYYSEINNMILWQPSGADWEAKNYSNVVTEGADVQLQHKVSIDKLQLIHLVSFAYNNAKNIKSGDSDTEKPLVYAPKYTGGFNSDISYMGFNLNLNWRFVSERLYDDYGGTLDPYWLSNIGISKKTEFGMHSVLFSVNIDNIFAKRYQMIRSYPMPLRMWQLKIKYLINLKNKQK